MIIKIIAIVIGVLILGAGLYMRHSLRKTKKQSPRRRKSPAP